MTTEVLKTTMEGIHITGLGWILPAGGGCGRELLESLARRRQWTADDNDRLADFSAKPYLSSVKGYLDPAGSFCLAACALALGVDADRGSSGPSLNERSGICTLTRFGATLSGYRFFQQFLDKGARYASPLVFPHSYPNTAGNLAAMEFGFGGPHMVYYGDQDVREGLEFAAARLEDGTARTMLVTAYESAEKAVLAAGRAVMHGAVALCMEASPSREPLLTVDLDRLRTLISPATARGMSAAMLDLLAALHAGD